LAGNYTPIQDWAGRQTKINEHGYTLVNVPEHPKSFCGGWYYEHRLVAEKRYGRVLKSWETVHHISEVKTDCSWTNLIVVTRKEHDKAVWLTA
jgi:hypothetical protein